MDTRKDSPAEAPANRVLLITRVFDAPRHLVFEAWTEKEHLGKWLAPRGFTIVESEGNLRPGGAWRSCMVAPDGVKHTPSGVYREIVQDELLVFTHAWEDGQGRRGHETLVTVRFADEGNKTKLTFEQGVFDTVESRDGHNGGWSQCLDILGEYLAKTPVIIERTFDAPVETVWQAITDIDKMKRWYFENLEAFEPEVGFETQFTVAFGGNSYVHLWKVTAATPGKKLTYSWRYEGYPGESFVTFNLFPEGGKTRMKLTHEELETFLPETNSVLAKGNFVGGWTHIIGSLERFLTETRDSHND